MAIALAPCPRCMRGTIAGDLGGERSCINCGFDPSAPSDAKPMVRGPRCLWDRYSNPTRSTATARGDGNQTRKAA